MAKTATKAPPAPAAAPSSNWKALKTALKPSTSAAPSSASPSASLKRKRSRLDSSAGEPSESKSSSAGKSKGKGKAASVDGGRDGEDDDDEVDGTEGGPQREKSGKKKALLPLDSILAGGTESWQSEPGQYLAMDCEMVGVGPEGVESTLARVSIVNYHGVVMLDRFVRPREKVTDYRTWVSGVREEDLRHAPSFVEVQKEVAALLQDRILIGHALSNDTQVLLLSHPRHMTRDTSKYAPLQLLARTKRPGLKALAKLALGIDIQTGEHSSVTDARVTMAIYRSQKTAWEDALRTHSTPTLVRNSTPALLALPLEPAAAAAGQGASNKRPKNMGIAATLRLARQEEAALAQAEAGEVGQEKLDERAVKKRKREEEDDMMVGFDYAPAPKVTMIKADVKPEKKEKKASGGVMSDAKKKVRKAMNGFKGDREKRPKSKEGWWEE